MDPSGSTRSEGSSTAFRTRWRNAPLHERCTMFDMERIKAVFHSKYKNKVTANEFRNMLKIMLNVEYDDEEFNILFLKINTSRTGEIDWDELVSHLILGYFGNDAENQREKMQIPIMGLPTVMRSQHRHPVSRICFCPDVAKDRVVNSMHGLYLTASRDGLINWWSLDMKLLRSARSSNPFLKVRTTWVTDMVCMPDVNIIVTSSTERDLRFYDCTAQNFNLKIIITSWDFMICTMFYYFHEDENEQCKLICGDVGGNVRLLLFSPKLRGPFKSQAAKSTITLRHRDLQKKPGLLPDLHLVELLHLHPEWVRQVSYYASLHCVMSCATCTDSLLMCDMHGSKTHNMFRVDKGIQCFAFDEEAHVLVTGGPDCKVRVWSPFVTAKATVTFFGHHAGIICIVLQNKGQTIYSLSRDRVIKVWDVPSHVCVQTYIDIPAEVGERSPISAIYNPATNELILAAIKIAIIVLDEQLNPLHTDGFTHSRAVSKVLYNPLFKVIITCGLDSIIINWDPVTGKRNVLIREAHVRQLHGEQIPVEITAACFDPGFQSLLTGSRNGELKTWNFNTGVCLRVLHIEHMCQVTSCFWVEGRVLAVGWNRRVTEFEDTGIAVTSKRWETRHTEDILAAAVRPKLTLATASYNSELILWRLETGQAYRRFSCTEPMLRIKMHYGRHDSSLLSPASSAKKVTKGVRKYTADVSSRDKANPSAPPVKKPRHQTSVNTPTAASTRQMRQLAVQDMIFLQTRPHHINVASIVLALENGIVQCWSDHSAGGYKGSFQVIHTPGDYVSTLATDNNNEFLFTGTTKGYVKVWLIINYLRNEEVHVNMPRLRLMFPFLWRDRIEGRAKRTVRDQPLPLLLNSYRAHLRCITTLTYVDELKLVFTGSSDYSVRVWRLSGEYLQTLGSFVPWTLQETRFPPDVKKVASFTTFKVWRGGYVSRFVPGKKEVDKLSDITERELQQKTYGAPAPEPLLGKYLPLPSRPERAGRIELDDTMTTIPLYAHLRMASTTPVRRPPTPELVRDTRLRRATSKKSQHDSSLPETKSTSVQLSLPQLTLTPPKRSSIARTSILRPRGRSTTVQYMSKPDVREDF